MTDDEAFLRAALAAPDDAAPRLIYADWLDERGDPRADYLRLGCRLAALPVGHSDAPAIRRQLIALRPGLPAWWLAALGDHRVTRTDPDPVRIDPDPVRIAQVADGLGRPARFVATDGYEQEIVAAVRHPLGDAVAYVECRSRQVRPDYVDIEFFLTVRGRDGREGRWPIESYNQYFGCAVGFLEWFGPVAVAVYQEKHRTYACRFGPDAPPVFKEVEDDWVIDGSHLGHRGYGETVVRRLSLPGLADLPSLSVEEAAAWDLVPPE